MTARLFRNGLCLLLGMLLFGCSPNAKSSIQNSTSMSELPKISQPILRLFQVPAFHFSPFEFAPVNSP